MSRRNSLKDALAAPVWNNKKLVIFQLSIDRKIDKLWQSHNGILFGNENKWNIAQKIIQMTPDNKICNKTESLRKLIYTTFYFIHCRLMTVCRQLKIKMNPIPCTQGPFKKEKSIHTFLRGLSTIYFCTNIVTQIWVVVLQKQVNVPYNICSDYNSNYDCWVLSIF